MRDLKTNTFLLLCGLVLLAGGAAMSLIGQTRAASTQRILLPAYFYPSSLWQQANKTPGIWMIMNPNSGPGTTANSDYVTSVNQAKSNGARIIGYVATGYGSRSLEVVQAEIEKYYAWYNVDGIFLDEVTTDKDHLVYYQALANFIRTHTNKLVVLNPGTVPAEEYVALADSTVVFEGSARNYNLFSPPDWVWRYPASKFTHLVYQASSLTSYKQALKKSQTTNSGSVYITNDSLPNPWDTLPNYWVTETKNIQ